MNKAIPILLVTTAAPAIACLHLVRELREERAQTESLQARIAELEKSAAEAQVFTVVPRATPFSPPGTTSPEAARTPSSAPSARTSFQGPETRIASGAVAPEDPRQRIRAHLEQRRAMLANPEYRDAVRARARLDMRQHYPGFAAELGLSEDEADKFTDLLAEHHLREMEQQELHYFADANDQEGMRQARERLQERMRQQQAEIEMHLGPSNYQKWKEYEQTLGQRHRLASVQSRLALAGAPLDAEQSKALLSALVQEQRTQQQAVSSSGFASASPQVIPMVSDGVAVLAGQEDWLDRQEQSNKRLLAEVKSNLTSQQVSHLEEMFASELDLHRTHLKLQQAQPENVTRSISAPGLGLAVGYAEQAVVIPPSGSSETP